MSENNKRQQETDRRNKQTDMKRRRFLRRERAFVYDRIIYLSDTNAFRNVYFATYFKFIGEAREDLLAWLCGPHLEGFMNSGINLNTVDTSIKYKLPLYFYDSVHIKITVPKISRMKLFLHIEIVHERTKKVHAVAEMTVSASHGMKNILLPEALVVPIKKLFLGE